MTDRDQERKDASEATTAQVYIVQAGDSLEKLAMRFYEDRGRWREIYDANRRTLDGTSLRPGQRIVIPNI